MDQQLGYIYWKLQQFVFLFNQYRKAIGWGFCYYGSISLNYEFYEPMMMIQYVTDSFS